MPTKPSDALPAPEGGFDLQAELDEVNRALKEIVLMIEQSQGELAKLTQRNAAITAHLQQAQSRLDRMPIEEVRMAYDSAMEAQQRLFVMRGQLDKLQSDRAHLERYRTALERMRAAGVGGAPAGGTAARGSGALASAEMLINAQEAERQRLSRQMHDGPAQALSNFILQAEIAMRLLAVDPAQAREELANLKAAAMSTFQKVRGFIFELRPMSLDDLGLVPTVRRYADSYKEQSGMDINLTVTGNERRLPQYLEVMIFRALQELLGNAARHSQGTLVKVHLDLGEDVIKVSVDDNGKGFDVETLQSSGSLGLKLIRERVELMGGTFQVDSAAGKGTRVTFAVPARV